MTSSLTTFFRFLADFCTVLCLRLFTGAVLYLDGTFTKVSVSPSSSGVLSDSGDTIVGTARVSVKREKVKSSADERLEVQKKNHCFRKKKGHEPVALTE